MLGLHDWNSWWAASVPLSSCQALAAFSWSICIWNSLLLRHPGIFMFVNAILYNRCVGLPDPSPSKDHFGVTYITVCVHDNKEIRQGVSDIKTRKDHVKRVILACSVSARRLKVIQPYKQPHLQTLRIVQCMKEIAKGLPEIWMDMNLWNWCGVLYRNSSKVMTPTKGINSAHKGCVCRCDLKEIH